jgi:ABC-type Fe3+-hydroxamate transport system substrate-binding protein
MPNYQLEDLYRLPDWDKPPQRVVSLVPSMTASLFGLGFGDSVVGVTDYCTRPAEKLIDLVRVGGPKTPNLQTITDLAPDLVIVNQEENSREAVEELLEHELRVWMVFPKTVQESIDVLRSLLALYHTDRPAIMINTLQMAVDYAVAALETQRKIPYFSPIWMGQEQGVDWFMTFNQDTYLHDVLRIFGGKNVFASRQRRFPFAADLGLEEENKEAVGDRRYPCVSASEVVSAAPELVLVPDEPYAFTGADKEKLFQLLADTPAVKNKNVHFIDGSLISWDGVRLGAALQDIPEYFMA